MTTSAAPGLFYQGIRAVIRAALGVFYRTIEVTGTEHLDPSAPSILACNHPNSIVDPLLLAMVEERQIRFCARDGLFKIPGFGALLRSVGAVPLRRRSDYGGGAVDNRGAFEACRAALDRGGVLAIFPEGKTHERLRIEPIKTGVARIALDAASGESVTADQVVIVPIGITYLVRHAFLSDVHVAIGKPIRVADFARSRQAEEDEAETVRALTANVEEEMRDLAVHIEEAEDERFIAQVTSLVAGIRADAGLDEGGQSPAERTALTQRVVDAYRWLKTEEPFETAMLRQRLEAYMEERRMLGLGGERPTLQHRGERRWMLTGVRYVVFLIAGAPLCVFGLAVSMVPYVLLRTSLYVVRPSTDRVALFKLIGGAISFGACLTAEIYAVARYAGPLIAALFAVSLIPAMFFAHRYVTETRIHRLQLRSATVFFRSARMFRLRAERRALSEKLSKLRDRYLARQASG